MDEVEDQSVELIVTSPPYPMIEMWDAQFAEQDRAVAEALAAQDGVRAFEGMHRLLDAVWAECARVLVPGGIACINVGDATRTVGGVFQLYTNHARVIRAFAELGLQSLPAVLWRKQTNAPNKFMGSGMYPAGAYVTLEHEYILIFRKGDKRSFDERAKRRRRQSAFFWEERNEWFSDVWSFKGVRQELVDGKQRERSGAFPFELAYRLVNMYSLQGDTVLDPFLGTATTTAAGIASGRHTVGYERDLSFVSMIDTTVNTAPAAGNARGAERLREHEAFVARREAEDKPLKHRNRFYGFAVMTRQEQELQLPTTSGVRTTERADARLAYEAEHRPLELREPHDSSAGAAESAQSAQWELPFAEGG